MILTEFKNRKVVYQELYEGRIIIIAAIKANGFNPESYSTFICNKKFDVLSDDSHNEDNGIEDIASLVNMAKTTISRFLYAEYAEIELEYSCSTLSYYFNMLLHLGQFAIAGMILSTWEVVAISYE